MLTSFLFLKGFILQFQQMAKVTNNTFSIWIFRYCLAVYMSDVWRVLWHKLRQDEKQKLQQKGYSSFVAAVGQPSKGLTGSRRDKISCIRWAITAVFFFIVWFRNTIRTAGTSHSLAAMKANDANLNKANYTLAWYKHFIHGQNQSQSKVIFLPPTPDWSKNIHIMKVFLYEAARGIDWHLSVTLGFHGDEGLCLWPLCCHVCTFAWTQTYHSFPTYFI